MTVTESRPVLRIVLLLAAVAVPGALAACGPAAPEGVRGGVGPAAPGDAVAGLDLRAQDEAPGEDEPPPFRMHLEEVPREGPDGGADADADADAGGDRGPSDAAAPARPLDGAAVDALLARIDPLPPAEERAFSFLPGSRPAPVTGEEHVAPLLDGTRDEAPGDAPPGADPGPLTVSRHGPEGDVPLAAALSATFSQPMVPLATLDHLDGEAVPVRLEPAVPGAWRWLGTRTLLFEPGHRFPMASRFTAEVPAGTRSLAGGVLDAPVRWTFTTPVPRLVDHAPSGRSVDPRAVHLLVFDQRVEPAAVLDHVRVEVPGLLGARRVDLRLATDEEVAADERVARRLEDAPAGHAVAFVAAEPLPLDTEVGVNLPPGLPSAEGPRRTDALQGYAYATYGPLQLVSSGCRGWDGDCGPGATWTLEFTNALDPASVDADLVAVEPSVDALEVSASGHALRLRGATVGGTTYTVTVRAGLRDEHGQILAEPVTAAFDVAHAAPAFSAVPGELSVLDPLGPPVFTVDSVNVDAFTVELRRVTPEEVTAHPESWTDIRRGRDPALPGERVLRARVEPGGALDERRSTVLDLSPALPEGTGHVLVVLRTEVDGEVRASMHWVQATDLAVDAVVDGGELLAWVTGLADGAPVPGARVALHGTELAATTDAGGLAVLRLPDGDTPSGGLLTATLDDDVVLLPESSWSWRHGGSHWTARERAAQDVVYTFDDRGVYRPGETVHLKGWFRRVDRSPGGGTGPVPDVRERTVRWTFRDARGAELAAGEEPLDAFGGFALAVEVPRDANLGSASFHTALDTTPENRWVGAHAVQVRDFRTPRYEVAVSAAPGPHVVGDAAVLTAAARYYAGGPLPDAAVDWVVEARPASFTPAGWDGWTFGEWVPWWGSSWSHGWRPDPGPDLRWTASGTTGADGTHALAAVFDEVDPPRPMALEVSAAVTDVDAQQWAGRADLLVHPSALCVGLRTERGFVREGATVTTGVVVTDLDGAAVAGREVALRAWRTASRWDHGEWVQDEVDVQERTLASGGAPLDAEWTLPTGGRWTVEARVADDRGRPHVTSVQVWVAGGEPPTAGRLELQDLELVPDRREYGPGDVAEVLVVAPFADGEGLLVLGRDGRVHEERFTLDGPTATVRVPVTDAHVPGVTLAVEVVGDAPRTDDAGDVLADVLPRPAYASGSLALTVSRDRERLALDVRPAHDVLPPGAETSAEVVVTDADGAPVPGVSVALVVVDEAVLALTGHTLGDPLDVFLPRRGSGLSIERLRRYVVLNDPLPPDGAWREDGGLRWRDARDEDASLDDLDPVGRALDGEVIEALSALGYMDGGGGGGGRAVRAPAAMKAFAADGGDADPVALRSRFDALAVFAPATTTDADGRVTVPFTLPGNLTRWRVRAVAVDPVDPVDPVVRAGLGEATLTARLPLMVRPGPPRFLDVGDAAEVPVVVQNTTDGALDVEVAADGTGLELVGARGWRLVVPPSDRVELLLPVEAPRAGTARLALVASARPVDDDAAPAVSDAARVSFPVRTPATTEAFATYGRLDDDVLVQPVALPADVYPEAGGLDVTLSSTALSALTDAVLSVTTYPYGCAEQRASRVLTVAALQDVLAAFDAEGLPDPDALVAAVREDLAVLASWQRRDGAFGFWRDGEPSPWVSVHVAHAFVRARGRGFEVPAQAVERSMAYLGDLGTRVARDDAWSRRARETVLAYGLRVEALAGRDVLERARSLLEDDLDALPLEAAGFLLAALAEDPRAEAEVARLLRHARNRVTETAGAAHFVTAYEDGAAVLLHGEHRTDGVLLDALLAVDPADDLLPKLVTGLLGSRVRGHWGSTQEDVFALLGLARYFRAVEHETPDLTARVWWDGRAAAERRFVGRSPDRERLHLPMAQLVATGGTGEPLAGSRLVDLVLSASGPGLLYYRLGLASAPSSLRLQPREAGFTVARRYEALDDPADVRRDPDGAWRIRRGARVRVRLDLVAPAERAHVALVDPVPAGLEPLDAALEVSAAAPNPTPDDRLPWWQRPDAWVRHSNLRDERAEAFTTRLPAGVHAWSWDARATTPGTFRVPPPKAEEMYAPETFGRGATDVVIVE